METLKKEKIFLIVGGIVTLLLIGTVGAVDAAFYAPPGTPLFPLGEKIQTIAMALLTQPQQKAALSLNIANSNMSALGTKASVNSSSIIKNAVTNDQKAISTIAQIANASDKQQAIDNLNISLNAQLQQLNQAKTSISASDITQYNAVITQAQNTASVTITPISDMPLATMTVPVPVVTQPTTTPTAVITTVPNGLLVTIAVSGSTNTPAYSLLLNTDGSGSLTYTDKSSYAAYTNKVFAKATFAVASFAAELAKVADVSMIPTGHCIKSVSFGTTTMITYNGKTSGDIQCLGNATVDQKQVVTDANTFLSDARSK